MANKPAPGFAPLYCGMYPEMAEVVRKRGYALAVHGSLRRDFDLICIPWTKNASIPMDVVCDLIENFSLKQVGDPDITHHGRIRYPLSISYGECFIDLSFMPLQSNR